ncbi:hypothetical protein APR41_15925 [Salegentibacter salinarum]|uniref:Outer membrane protein beta-barrel domain-containing protein n=1 Tax=Salegentibacter salinarum TaxID=447422 RepID=A0A2N0TXH9_9FLAO|nr:outer membrane beta-barrel protein [Salegentibacter salinarum]PKD19447.1 hypothetical protein APR41_15925 [Salegentibacter salinarum]SKB92162.1 outer membrane protein X [Salegentibacter salinarum]
MKKTLFSIILMLGFLSTTQAQEETRIGGFLAYGTEIENLGIGVNAEFPVMEKLSISPSVIYYFPKEEYGFKMNWLEFNANANYYFLNNSDLGVYALGGLNYSSIKVSYDDSWGMGGNFSASDGRFGLNLGGGLNFDIGSSILPFAEIKYVILDSGQLVASAGVKFKL